MESLLHFLNPLSHLGEKQYSFRFPFLVMLLSCIVSEVYAYQIARDPMSVGSYAIFIFVALIIYFAFREGLKGGLIASSITILYYLYIISTRHYTGRMLTSGVETTFILGLLYLLLSVIIGGLKQRIDTLIEREAGGKVRLQAILQQLPVGIVITDKKGHIEHTNKQLELIMGRPIRQDVIVGKETLPNATSHNKPVTPSQWPLVQVLHTGRSVKNKEFQITKSDGKATSLLLSATPIRNREGKVIAAACIMTDISAQKELEKRKDDFINMASHELKTPLTSMKLYLDSLTRNISATDNERAKKTLSSIHYQTDRLEELVRDLLDVSRMQTGKLSFFTETFRLDQLLETTIAELQASTKQQLLFASKSAITITADKFRLAQVLTNLITNASKYSQPQTTITIRLKKEHDMAVVSIQDQGIGIAKGQQKKIFERLYQVTESTEKTFPGFGMGLYIAKEIITRHKGKIWVDSEKGKGATFFFSLPLTKKKV